VAASDCPCGRLATSTRRSQSLRGHMRKLVSQLGQNESVDQSYEYFRPIHREANAVIAPVAIERPIDPVLLFQQSEQLSLLLNTELLRVEVHRVPRSASVIHDPHGQCEWRECDLRYALSTVLIRKASSTASTPEGYGSRTDMRCDSRFLAEAVAESPRTRQEPRTSTAHTPC
jgi:hypothetical protein